MVLKLYRLRPAVIALAALISIAVQTANAAQIPINDPTFGIGSVTRDTATNLEWLDLTETLGQSHDSVQSQLGTTYQGWRIATLAEVQTLLSNGGIPLAYTAFTPASSGPLAAQQQLKALLGDTMIAWDSYYTGFFGIVSDSPGANYYRYVSAYEHTFYNQLFISTLGDASSTGGHVSVPHYGTFLVRGGEPAAVPAPGSLWLLGLGLIFLGMARRKVGAV